jgi:hypothetical protein
MKTVQQQGGKREPKRGTKPIFSPQFDPHRSFTPTTSFEFALPCTFTAARGIFSLGNSSIVKTKSCNKKVVNSYPVSLNGTEFLSLL